ncbi:MAG: hypothetical protein VCB43_08495, partial [Myxococcota bacterium]
MKNRNLIIAACVAFAVSLAALLYAIGGGQEPRAPQGSGSSSVQPASPSAAHLGAATDDSDSAQSGQPRTDASPSTSLGAPTLASRLHGTIVVFGGGQFIGNARKHAREDGLLTLEALDGDTKSEVEVSVAGGVWSLEIEPGVRYRIVRATLGARLTRVEDAPILLASEVPIALTARWVTDVRLHVVDAELGIELVDVDVIVQKSWEARWDYPTAASLESALITGAPSPVLIEVDSGRFRVRVRARGYSWADVEIDFDQGAERTVKLSPAASLVVIADVGVIEQPVQVRLYPGGWDNPDPAFVGLDLVPGQPTVFENLSTGDHQIRVEFGYWRDPPMILAQQEVTLIAGERKTVTLTKDARLVVPRTAALSGTLELPAGAADFPIEIQIRPGYGPGWRSSDKQRIPLLRMQALGDGKTYRWHAGEVSSGRVNLIVHPMQVSVVIDLLPVANREVHLEVPELAHVHVHAVDKSNAKPLPVDMYLAWSKFEVTHRHLLPHDPGSLTERSIDPQYMQADAPGRGSFYVPIGRTLIAVGYRGYERESRWVEIVPGKNEFYYALKPFPTLLVGFLHGEDLVPAPHGLTVRALDNDSQWRRSGPVAGRLLGTVEQPGRYLISAPAKANYVFPPREVTIG